VESEYSGDSYPSSDCVCFFYGFDESSALCGCDGAIVGFDHVCGIAAQRWGLMGYSFESSTASLLIVGLVVVVFMGVIANIASENPSLVDAPSSNFTGNMSYYDKLEDIHNQSETLSDTAQSVSTDANALDVLGGFLSKGIKTIQLIGDSFQISQNMVDHSLKQVHLTERYDNAFRYTFIGLLMIGIGFAFIKIFLRRENV
jgi:hypothetical protein